MFDVKEFQDFELFRRVSELLSYRSEVQDLDPIAAQLHEMFFMAECVASARIEGNHTTITDYLLRDRTLEDTDLHKQITNILSAIRFVQDTVDVRLDAGYIRELHRRVTEGLQEEGDRNPGCFRSAEVRIQGADVCPPSAGDVPDRIHQLVQEINAPCEPLVYLLKTLWAHHAFTVIHPFENGNGRTARLLTYAMLARAGLTTVNGWALHPSVIFSYDREAYYHHLTLADRGDISAWMRYMADGLVQNIRGLVSLGTHQEVARKNLAPLLRKLAPGDCAPILVLALCTPGGIRPADVKKILPDWSEFAVSRRLRSLRESGWLKRDINNKRLHHLQLLGCKPLLRAMMEFFNRKGLLLDDQVMR